MNMVLVLYNLFCVLRGYFARVSPHLLDFLHDGLLRELHLRLHTKWQRYLKSANLLLFASKWVSHFTKQMPMLVERCIWDFGLFP